MTDSPGRMPEQPTESDNRAELKPGQPVDSAKGVRQAKPPIDENPWATAGMVLGLGAELAVCVGLGWWLGTVYDDRNGTEYGYLVGVMIGLIAGIGSAITLIRKYTGKRRP